jgi:hypothetical protein
MRFNKFIERDLPHIVEIVVPRRGNRRNWDAMIRFHARHNIKPHRNHGRYKDGCMYARWYFADSELAEAFEAKFAKQGRMSRYKRHASAREIEKAFPHIVETDVPRGGFGKQLDAMYEFHIRRGVRAINSTGRHDENGRYYVRWRFADPALADTFATEFKAQEKRSKSLARPSTRSCSVALSVDGRGQTYDRITASTKRRGEASDG